MLNLAFLNQKSQTRIPPVVLLVLDGFGIAPDSSGNAIEKAKTPYLDFLRKTYLYGELIAAGESVGLPANEDGNSDVGHLTIGAGRTVYQSLVRINKSIEEGSFYDNPSLINAIGHIKRHSSKLHIMGMVSAGSVHSDISHFWALVEFCRRKNITDVSFHLFTDGRDAPPNAALAIIKDIEEKLETYGVGKIATIAGRYFAMDRDARWDRTKLVYDALTLGRAEHADVATEAIDHYYAQGVTDEFITPTVINSPTPHTIDSNDAVVFFNFRIDRPRQLTMAFVLPNFEDMKYFEFGYVPHDIRLEKTKSKGPTFKREKKLDNLYFITMTEYQKNLPVSDIMFPPTPIKNTLPEIISTSGLRQLHLAESEKERMVTFYLDGLREEKFPGEDVAIIASPNVATYDRKPEMSVFKIVSKFKKGLKNSVYEFFAINFANPDMVAHSGNMQATIKAIEIIDKAVKEVVVETLKKGGIIIISADHGNAEELLTYESTTFYFTTGGGKVNTEHSNNPVPLYIIGNLFVSQKGTVPLRGSLSDIAPTILAIMGIEKPPDMTGRNLLDLIRRDV